MKSRIAKGVISFTLCIAMVLGNVGYAFAAEDVSGNTTITEDINEEQQPVVSHSVTPETTPGVSPEVTPVVIPDEEIPQAPAPTQSVSENDPEPTASVSENTVSENTVSENTVSENTINLPLSEDGKYYVLTKNIEGRSITITLNIPVELFPEATEISFDAVEAEQEVKDTFEEVVQEDVEGVGFVNQVELFDITLYVNNEKVEKFDDTIQIVFSGTEIPTATADEETVEVYYFDETAASVDNLSEQTVVENEEVKVNVEHFSSYGIVTITAAKYQKKADILNGLGVARNFAVFADDFTNTSHMEGNIAVNKLHVNNNIDMTNNEIAQSSDDFTVTLTKTVAAGSKGGTFYFAFYTQKNPSANDVPVATQKINVASGGTEKIENITLNNGNKFDGAASYYVYETDATGKIYNNGQECYVNGYKYEVSFSTAGELSNQIENNEISNIGNISFVKSFDGGQKEVELFNAGIGVINTNVVFGDGYSFFREVEGDSTKKIKGIKDNSGNSVFLNPTNSSYYIANGNASINGVLTEENYGAFSINFDEEFNDLKQLSADLSVTTDVSDDGTTSELLVYNVPADEAHKDNGKQNEIDQAITNNPDKLIVINVDCTGKEEFTWNSGYYLNGEGRNWDGDKKVSKYGNVIWNFYETQTTTVEEKYIEYTYQHWVSTGRFSGYYEHVTTEQYKGRSYRDEDRKYWQIINTKEKTRQKSEKTYQSYDGTLTINGEVGGTILAPDATVNTLLVEGTVIAKNLTIKNEIHEVLLKNDKVEVNCTNKQNGTVPVETPVTIEQDKTAQLTDWDKRTYDIDLDVWTNDTIQQNSDIILVLDRSGSMEGDKMNALKGATQDFITGLSVGDRVAIVAFDADLQQGNESNNGENYYSHNKPYTVWDYATIDQQTLNASTYNTSLLGSRINSLVAKGGTRQDIALEQAMKYLDSNNNANTKSIILFTDGVPDEIPIRNTNDYRNCVSQIETFRQNCATKNAVLYTVAFGVNGTQDIWNSYSPYGKDLHAWYANPNALTPSEWLRTKVATSEQHAFDVTKAEDLKQTFVDIRNMIEREVTITDTIDNRFVLLSEDGKNVYTSKLSSDMTNGAYGVCINGGETKSEITGLYGGATLTADAEGRLVLTWTDVKVKDIYKAKDDASQGGFVRKLHVWAKEDYIGGNAIPTNYGPTSKVTTESPSVEFEYEDGKFPEPKANVKVRFDADRAVTEMFWGEKLVGNKETIKNAVEQFDYLNNKTYEDLLYVGDKENLTYTENGKTVDLYYYENGVKSATPITYSEDIFATTWYSTKTGTEYSDEMTKEEMGKVSEVGNFYLEFAFTGAGDSTEKSKRASTIGTEAYEATSENSTAVGEYEVKIIAGKITIIKNIEGDYSEIDGDPIFTYKIEDVSEDKIDGFTNKTYYKTLRFMNGAGDQLFATITGLPKGEYVISELDTMGFKEVSHGFTKNTNCYTDGDTVYLGYRRSGVESGNLKNLHTFTATIGEMSYTNECNHTHEKLTHTDTVKNTYVINPDGTAWNYKDSQEDVDNGEKQELPYSGSDGNAGNTNSPLKSALLLPSPDTLNGQKENDEPNQENSQE